MTHELQQKQSPGSNAELLSLLIAKQRVPINIRVHPKTVAEGICRYNCRVPECAIIAGGSNDLGNMNMAGAPHSSVHCQLARVDVKAEA